MQLWGKLIQSRPLDRHSNIIIMRRTQEIKFPSPSYIKILVDMSLWNFRFAFPSSPTQTAMSHEVDQETGWLLRLLCSIYGCWHCNGLDQMWMKDSEKAGHVDFGLSHDSTRPRLCSGMCICRSQWDVNGKADKMWSSEVTCTCYTWHELSNLEFLSCCMYMYMLRDDPFSTSNTLSQAPRRKVAAGKCVRQRSIW